MSKDDIKHMTDAAPTEFPQVDIAWGEPEPIQNELLPVDPLPTEALPEPFHDFILDVAHRMQCPVDFVAIALLGIVSSIVGAGCGVKPKKEDDWLVIPNLWGCIVASPGKLKSPAAASAIGFIEKLEKTEKEKFNQAMKDCEVELHLFEAEKKSILNQISNEKKRKKNAKFELQVLSLDQLKDDYRNMVAPTKPICRRFKTNDTTIQKLAILLSENLRGLFYFRDEIMGLLTTWDKIGHENDRAFFLEAWNGFGTFSTDRVSRDSADAENMCISIFGTTQPDKLIRYLSTAANGNNDGLIQRFQLMVYPDDKQWELVDRKPNVQAKEQVFNIINKLAYMNFSEYGAKQDCDNRLYFNFDDSAQEVFYQWLTDLEQEKIVAPDDHVMMREHLSKYRKLMPALALLFHLIDLADGKQSNSISTDNTLKACTMCDYLESHARRIYGLVTDIETLAAATLANKIKNKKLKDGFTQRDVYRQKGLLKNKKLTKIACDELIELGWLREVITPPAKGQKEKITYLINPKINRGNHG